MSHVSTEGEAENWQDEAASSREGRCSKQPVDKHQAGKNDAMMAILATAGGWRRG